MKIRLRALGLPYTTGILKQPQTTRAGADYSVAGLSINELYYRAKTGIVEGVRLGVAYWAYIPYRSVTQAPMREDLILMNMKALTADTAITSILWQSESIIRVTFESTIDLRKITAGMLLVVSSATDSSNNGSFVVTTVDNANHYVEILNEDRIDNSEDETSSPAVVTRVDKEYDIVDIQEKIQSEFEDHYLLNIVNRNR